MGNWLKPSETVRLLLVNNKVVSAVYRPKHSQLDSMWICPECPDTLFLTEAAAKAAAERLAK